MTLNKLGSIFAIGSALVLAACGGGGNGSAPQQEENRPVVAFDSRVGGDWSGATAGNETFQFFSAPTEAPFTAELKTGRMYKDGKLINNFFWEIDAKGTLNLSAVHPSCDTRPLNGCQVVKKASIVARGNSINHGMWSFEYDDNADGKVDRKVSDVYDRKDIDLTGIPNGEMFLTRSDVFSTPLQASVSGNKFTVRMTDFGLPVLLSANFSQSRSSSISFNSGEATAVNTTRSFAVTGVGNKVLPVKVWYDKVELSASADNGFILEYEIHRQIQVPAGTDPASIPSKASYEKPYKNSLALNVVRQFVSGPAVRAGDKFATTLPLDFNPAVVLLPAGNEISFTSATEGVLSHTDMNFGKYSESRAFTWVRRNDGAIVLTFQSGFSVLMQFVKQVTGGYQVLYTLPDPRLGKSYFLHDIFVDQPSTITAENIVGRYTFTSNNGVTPLEVTIHKDKTVSGVVNGFWFIDSNNDFVSFECTDLAGKSITSYEACYATFQDLSKMSLSHVRRLKFLHKEGNNYQVKYDSMTYGAQFGIVNRDYITVAWTYRWTRVGDE